MTSFLLVCAMGMTQVQIWTKDDKVQFRLDDRAGAGNLPIYEGVVIAPMLPLLERAKKDLAVFQGSILVQWNKDKCKVSAAEPLLMECSGPGEILEPKNTGLVSTGLITGIEQIERIDMKYDRLKIHWGVDSHNPTYFHHFISFPFNKQNCRASLK